VNSFARAFYKLNVKLNLIDGFVTDSHSQAEKIIGVDETLIYSENDTAGGFLGVQIAPGEGKTPIPLHMDQNAEIMSFPSIYCGQERKIKEKVDLQ